MNYFEFYQIPVSFQVNEPELKRIFYLNSKKYHPDFHTLSEELQQAEMLEMSSLNNEAYKTLSDPDRRMRYVLELYGLLGDDASNPPLPRSFLMDMMDINEALMELEFDLDAEKLDFVKKSVEQLELQLDSDAAPLISSANHDQGALSAIRDYYLKKRYLLRIKENLAKLGSNSDQGNS